jgi:hypothetical protein
MELPLCECGCGERVKKRGYRFAANGHQHRTSAVAYIVDPVTDCWIWQRATKSFGYGDMRHNGRNRPAHVVFYEEKYGPVPPGMELDHVVCNTPPCCNPDHVKPVTHAENTRRGARAKLTPEIRAAIRALDGTMSRRAIGRRFGVHHQTISDFLDGSTWS